MNSRKVSARKKSHRIVALDIRPRGLAAPQGSASSLMFFPTGKPGKVKRLEMTTNDLRTLGHALLAEQAPAPNATLINLMKQANAWL